MGGWRAVGWVWISRIAVNGSRWPVRWFHVSVRAWGLINGGQLLSRYLAFGIYAVPINKLALRSNGRLVAFGVFPCRTIYLRASYMRVDHRSTGTAAATGPSPADSGRFRSRIDDGRPTAALPFSAPCRSGELQPASNSNSRREIESRSRWAVVGRNHVRRALRALIRRDSNMCRDNESFWWRSAGDCWRWRKSLDGRVVLVFSGRVRFTKWPW